MKALIKLCFYVNPITTPAPKEIEPIEGTERKAKQSGGLFGSEVVRSPVPKCEAFGWTSTQDAKRLCPLIRTRKTDSNRQISVGFLIFITL